VLSQIINFLNNGQNVSGKLQDGWMAHCQSALSSTITAQQTKKIGLKWCNLMGSDMACNSFDNFRSSITKSITTTKILVLQTTKATAIKFTL
jgi:hypothetical protein